MAPKPGACPSWRALRQNLRQARSQLRFVARLLTNALWARLRSVAGGCLGLAWARPWARREAPEIERLQAAAAGNRPGRRRDVVEAATRMEVLAEVLAFCNAQAVGRCAAVSLDFEQVASSDAVWHELCQRAWQGRQHSAHMRRWLSAASLRPAAEDLQVDFACEEQLRRAGAAARPPWREPLRRCRVASWRDRYVFAERDAQRSAITREELCWDSPCAQDPCLRPEAGKGRAAASGQRTVRRWSVTIHFERSFDVEAFFHEDGNFRDTARFRDVPWRFVYSPDGEVSVQIIMERPSLAPFRVKRTADWGWQLISTGSFTNMAVFTSRQLGPTAHEIARRVPPEIATLYMQWCLCPGAAGARCRSVYGVWRCFGAYQGTMPASSLKGAEITVAPGTLTVTLADSVQVSHRCAVDEETCAIDVFRAEASGEAEGRVWRGAYWLDLERQVLVACRNERGGGPRPVELPEGLPSVEEAMRDAQLAQL